MTYGMSSWRNPFFLPHPHLPPLQFLLKTQMRSPRQISRTGLLAPATSTLMAIFPDIRFEACIGPAPHYGIDGGSLVLRKFPISVDRVMEPQDLLVDPRQDQFRARVSR